MSVEAPLIFLVAGEISSDLIGQRLMSEFRQRLGAVRFAGVGGPRMAEEGLESLFPLAELSLVGVGEVLPHLPNLFRRMRQTTETIAAEQPALVLFIDASGFARGVARRLRKAAVPVPIVQYKAPQTWAYWPWRAKAMARDFDLVLAILPFEPAHLADYGVTAAYIGHPALESGVERGDGAAFRARHGLAADIPLLCVLPGSRSSEVKRSLPVFGRMLERLTAVMPDLRVAVPTVESVAGPVAAAVAGWPGQPILVKGLAERFDAMAASRAAVTMTGTVTVELALAGLPMVACYKVAWLTAAFVRAFIRVKYVCMVNLLLGRGAVPEYLQHRCTPSNLTRAVLPLLRDPAAHAAQAAALAEARAILALPEGRLPTAEAARLVVEACFPPPKPALC